MRRSRSVCLPSEHKGESYTGISNEEVVRSGLEGLEELLRKTTLRWFGHEAKKRRTHPEMSIEL